MITSVKNQKVKHWRKLKQKKERDRHEQFLIEGYHLIEEAHNSDWSIQEIIYQEQASISNDWYEYPLFEVTENIMEAITETKTPQGIAAIVEKKNKRGMNFTTALVLDHVQDPGNVGTMIRTADAAGFDTVILGDGSADVYNNKVLRASQGSIFHIDLFEANLLNEVTRWQNEGITIWTTGLTDHAKEYRQLYAPDRLALIVGNEGAGVQNDLIQQADENVVIPIFGKAESLNVSTAAGIMMYHIAETKKNHL
ncbi:rRNA methylase [Gracilibacillus halophilus YIM-C55.5]|uniref:rRNA methylase n=1 Tax=Gracilibacillus halophilus YIM-C55.5 TaxID=1308866 RepID=N4WLL4_9BACI|nr:RNA methyltransferase [Gracilibacillus halophilus]ENH97042.1 rRNA methylase [Gracilibacillus halophilus YIM-C55.5]